MILDLYVLMGMSHAATLEECIAWASPAYTIARKRQPLFERGPASGNTNL